MSIEEEVRLSVTLVGLIDDIRAVGVAGLIDHGNITDAYDCAFLKGMNVMIKHLSHEDYLMAEEAIISEIIDSYPDVRITRIKIVFNDVKVKEFFYDCSFDNEIIGRCLYNYSVEEQIPIEDFIKSLEVESHFTSDKDNIIKAIVDMNKLYKGKLTYTKKAL